MRLTLIDYQDAHREELASQPNGGLVQRDNQLVSQLVQVSETIHLRWFKSD